MRLLIDARKIADGGIGTYTSSLLGALNPATLGVDSFGAVEPSIDLHISALINPEQRSRLPRYVTPLVTHLRAYSLGSFLQLSEQIPWGLYDLFHSPHFLLPCGVPIPSVVTVHDAIPLSHPSNVLHQRMMSYLLSRLVKTASAVVTVSQASARRLRELAGLECEVIPNILSFPAQAADSEVNSDAAKRYVVGVFSNTKPHKGQRVFAEACALSKVRGIAIGKGAQLLRSAPYVECIDELPWEDLLGVYRGASALVVASEVEGFCLPAMEAKALGVRVVSTPEPAVLEFLDENDEIATDFGAQALSLALYTALARPRADYLWSRAQNFSPQRVAQQLMNLYHRVLGRPVRGQALEDSPDRITV